MPLALGNTKEKLKNAIIYFVLQDKTVKLTKLMKLLFYLDFRHYRETGYSVTGMVYFAWTKGPVPAQVYEELINKKDHDLGLKGIMSIIKSPNDIDQLESKIKLPALAKFSNHPFTKREVKILQDVSEMLDGYSASLVSEASHEQDQPWDITRKTKGDNADIDYELAFRGLDQDTIDEIHEEQRDRQALGNFFEVSL